MRLGENVWRMDQQRVRNTGGFLWLSPACRRRDGKKSKKKGKLNEEMSECQIEPIISSWPSLGFSWISVSPVVSDSGSLYEAGRIGLLEQLLCVGHQACMLQQTSPLWDLGRQGLLPPAAGSLHSQSQSTLTLRYSCSQLSDAVSQLM